MDEKELQQPILILKNCPLMSHKWGFISAEHYLNIAQWD